MATLLLVIIYLTFISLGLSDALLGGGWPVMQAEFGAQIAGEGVVDYMVMRFETLFGLSVYQVVR